MIIVFHGSELNYYLALLNSRDSKKFRSDPKSSHIFSSNGLPEIFFHQERVIEQRSPIFVCRHKNDFYDAPPTEYDWVAIEVDDDSISLGECLVKTSCYYQAPEDEMLRSKYLDLIFDRFEATCDIMYKLHQT